MEGFITNYYEYHFLYINGIHHVESRNVQGMSLMKLQFHPARTWRRRWPRRSAYVNRSRAMMPPEPCRRSSCDSTPAACRSVYLVLSSDTAPVSVIQDRGLFHVRPMFASLPGVSAPPPFGGSARAIVVNCSRTSCALNASRPIKSSPRCRLERPQPLGQHSSRRQISDRAAQLDRPRSARVEASAAHARWRSAADLLARRDRVDRGHSTDLTTGYALVNGRRAVYMLVTKRADASTLSVVNEVKRALPKMRDAVKK